MPSAGVMRGAVAAKPRSSFVSWIERRNFAASLAASSSTNSASDAKRRIGSGRDSQRRLDAAQPLEAVAAHDAAEEKEKKPALIHDLDGVHRPARRENAEQLGANALPRQLSQAVPLPDDGGDRLAVEVTPRVLGAEPEEAEDAEIVFADPGVCIAHEPDDARLEIGKPAQADRRPRPGCRRRARSW